VILPLEIKEVMPLIQVGVPCRETANDYAILGIICAIVY
jgi:hypothetical protein